MAARTSCIEVRQICNSADIRSRIWLFNREKIMQVKITLQACCRRLVVPAVAVLITACGGGGGGDPPVPTYPLQSAYADYYRAGSNANYTASGYCSGTASVQRAPAIPAVFKAVSGSSVLESFSFQYSGCSNPALNVSDSGSGTLYFDASYAFLGSVLSDGSNSEFTTARPMALPASVVLGDQGSLGTLTDYTDSTRSTVNSTTVSRYSVEADSPPGSASVIVKLTDQVYSTTNQLLVTGEFRYRLTNVGVLTAVSVTSISNFGTLTWTRN